MYKPLLRLIAIFCMFSSGLFSQTGLGGSPKSEQLRMDMRSIPAEVLPQQDNNALIQSADQNEGFYSFGTIVPTNFTTSNSGTWTNLQDGGRVWHLKVQSTDAKGLTLYFQNFNLPANSSMYVYNQNLTQIHGAFSQHNNPKNGDFAISMILGQTIILEYFEPANVVGEGTFTVSGVGHAFRGVSYAPQVLRGFGDSDASCEINVNCSAGSTWQDQKRAVARILLTVGGQQGWCTGSLVNNVRQDCTPYFLTALHCGENASASNLNQWIFYFNYEASACTNPFSEPSSNSLVGVSKIADSNDGGGSTGSDFLLLRFPSNIPSNFNAYFAGWDAANSGSSSGVSIHHPKGDIKKISTYNTAVSNTSWGGITPNTHWLVYWSTGITEGGSSGSAIFNSNKQIIGTLTGGGSFCATPNNPDAYGKMSHHWTSNGSSASTRLKDWLDPDNTGTTSLNGIYSPCNAVSNDAGIVAIVTPSGVFCSSNLTPVVQLRNYGISNLVSVTINYQINSNNYSYNWTGNLASNATTDVTLNTHSVAGNSVQVTASTSNPNGTVDQNTGNDQAQSPVITRVTPVSAPYQQTFQSGFPANGVLNFNEDNDAFEWSLNTNVGGFSNSGNSVVMNNYDGTSANNPRGTFDYFILPPVDMTNLTNSRLVYDFAHALYAGSTSSATDSLVIYYSTDCGDSFFELIRFGGNALATANATNSSFVPSSNQWDDASISVSFLDGESAVYFAFGNISDWGNNVYLDNIGIEGTVNTEDLISVINFDLSPNPSDGIFNLELELESIENVQVSISNSLGQLIDNYTFNDVLTLNQQMDLSNYSNGIYFISVRFGNQISSKKLILARH